MIRLLLALIATLALALGWSLWRTEAHKGAAAEAGHALAAAEARADGLASQLADARRTLATERARADRMNRIATETQEELASAKDREADLAARIARGDVRVRHEIAALHTSLLSQQSAARRELDAAAQRGAELVAAAVGVGAKCDAIQRGLVEAYEMTRQEPEKPR